MQSSWTTPLFVAFQNNTRGVAGQSRRRSKACVIFSALFGRYKNGAFVADNWIPMITETSRD